MVRNLSSATTSARNLSPVSSCSSLFGALMLWHNSLIIDIYIIYNMPRVHTVSCTFNLPQSSALLIQCVCVYVCVCVHSRVCVSIKLKMYQVLITQPLMVR